MKTRIEYEAPDIEITRFDAGTNIMDGINNENFDGDDVHRGGSVQDVEPPEDITGW